MRKLSYIIMTLCIPVTIYSFYTGYSILNEPREEVAKMPMKTQVESRTVAYAFCATGVVMFVVLVGSLIWDIMTALVKKKESL